MEIRLSVLIKQLLYTPHYGKLSEVEPQDRLGQNVNSARRWTRIASIVNAVLEESMAGFTAPLQQLIASLPANRPEFASDAACRSLLDDLCGASARAACHFLLAVVKSIAVDSLDVQIEAVTKDVTGVLETFRSLQTGRRTDNNHLLQLLILDDALLTQQRLPHMWAASHSPIISVSGWYDEENGVWLLLCAIEGDLAGLMHDAADSPSADRDCLSAISAVLKAGVSVFAQPPKKAFQVQFPGVSVLNGFLSTAFNEDRHVNALAEQKEFWAICTNASFWSVRRFLSEAWDYFEEEKFWANTWMKRGNANNWRALLENRPTIVTKGRLALIQHIHNAFHALVSHYIDLPGVKASCGACAFYIMVALYNFCTRVTWRRAR
ncbi:hypothetical protein B0T24DRAFT_592965 [Lasiosphaeria ovina]|uniref:Uncharacterized protein n=1 Tax=Lasiosphaeria ovina TaxID=92902 RepID=A0AAE0KJW3_9PEZI|nr:hypothetical protein B0T24DRAFT_592965 [Lasiosphaeria ovina]